MTHFNEANTVEQMVLDTLTGRAAPWRTAEPQPNFFASHLTLHT